MDVGEGTSSLPLQPHSKQRASKRRLVDSLPSEDLPDVRHRVRRGRGAGPAVPLSSKPVSKKLMLFCFT